MASSEDTVQDNQQPAQVAAPAPEAAPAPAPAAAPEAAPAEAAAAPEAAPAAPAEVQGGKKKLSREERKAAKKADKKDPFDGRKLGFLRFIQIVTIFSIILDLVLMVFIKGSTVHLLRFASIAEILSISARALTIWIIARRMRVGLKLIPILLAFEFVDTLIVEFLYGNLSVVLIVLYFLQYGLLALYFLVSRRAKSVLVNDFHDMTLAEQQRAMNRKMWDPKSKDFWLRLILYFFAFSIMGHWMEMGVQLLVIHGIMPGTIAGPDSLTWRDKLNPFFIYGIAVAFCGLALYPVYTKLRDTMPKRWQSFLCSFLVNTLFCVAAELVLGFLFNADYHAWDYRDQFMNFQGQVCLLYSLLFGALASVITWLVYPLMERQFSYANRDVFRMLFVVALVLFLAIYFTYNVDLDTLMPGAGLSFDVSNTSITTAIQNS